MDLQLALQGEPDHRYVLHVSAEAPTAPVETPLSPSNGGTDARFRGMRGLEDLVENQPVWTAEPGRCHRPASLCPFRRDTILRGSSGHRRRRLDR